MSEKIATMEEQTPVPSFFSVLPATVRYDRELSSSAKLLYSEITALTEAKGYCWAKNSYFANLFEASEGTVRRWIRELEQRGHITREEVRDEGTKEIIQRRIWIVNPPSKNERPSVQKWTPPPSKNERENNIYINNTPYSPPQGTARKMSKERQQEVEHFFEVFWSLYPKKVDKKDTHAKFLRLAPDRPLMVKIYRALQAQMQTTKWREGYIPSPQRWIGKELWNDELPPTDALAPSRVVEDEEVTYW